MAEATMEKSGAEFTERDTRRLRNGESPRAYIARRIREIFDDLATELSGVEMPEEMAAGISFELFSKHVALVQAWDEIAERE